MCHRDPESVDAYTLRLNINGSVYREITGVASLSNSEYVPDLPFDARIEFEARFSRGAELSGAVKRSIVTEAEPVPEIRDAGPLWGALLSWDATEASAYRVYVRDENGVLFSSEPIVGTIFNVLAFIANGRPYTAWVVSLNQDGEECSYASDQHDGIATIYTGPG